MPTATLSSRYDALDAGLVALISRVTTPRFTSLYDWGKAYCPSYLTLPPGEHHLNLGTYLVAMSARRGSKLNFISPRDSAKSTFISNPLYPLYSICEQTEKYIILNADTFAQAVKYLETIKHELQYNEALRRDYPEACDIGSKWASDGITTRNGVRVEALGTGMAIRGRRENEDRPTLVITDDPQKDDIAYSVVQREHDWAWFTSGCLKAGSPTTNFILAGTNIHRESIVGKCRELPGWTQKFYRSIETYPARMDLWGEWEQILCAASDTSMEEKEALAEEFYGAHRQEMEAGAKVLWPERENLKALMMMRVTGGVYSFSAEKQNDPCDSSKCDWPASCFAGNDIYFSKWPEDLMATVCALDPSMGKTDKSGDFQAMVRVGIDANQNYWVDADITRRPLDECIDRYVAWCHGADKAVAEADSFQFLLQQDIREKCLAAGEVAKIHEPILTGGIPKAMRVRSALSTLISQRRLRFKRSTGTSELVRQLQDFPNGQHDDGPDALAYAIKAAEGYIEHSTRTFAKGGMF